MNRMEIKKLFRYMVLRISFAEDKAPQLKGGVCKRLTFLVPIGLPGCLDLRYSKIFPVVVVKNNE